MADLPQRTTSGMSLRGQAPQLDDEEDVFEDFNLPDAEGTTIVFQGSVIRTSYEGEELSIEAFEFRLNAPCSGSDVKTKICESCKVAETDFQDVGFELCHKPLVNRGSLSVKSSPAGLKVMYEYFMGCCGNISAIASVQQDEKTVQIPVTVTARAKPAKMSASTDIYVAVSVNEEDRRNDFQHSETFRVEVLRVDASGQQFQLSGYKVGKTYRGTPEEGAPALKGASEAVLEAIASGSVSKAGTCESGDVTLTLHSAQMKGGVLVDTLLQIQSEPKCLVEWGEAHYPRGGEGPQRWTKVWLYAGKEGEPSCGSSAKQPWLVYKDASPYCSGLCVPQSLAPAVSFEPASSAPEPQEL